MAIDLRWGAPLTVDDLERIPEDGHRYELVDGSLLVTPAPNLRHQEAIGSLYVALRSAKPTGYVVLFAPFDYRPSATTLLQPDLIVSRTADFTEARIERAPLLVVEVVSPSTGRIDRGTKRLAFEAAGVQSYWIVDPDEPSLLVLHLEAGRYVEHAHVSGEDAYEALQPFPVTIVPARLAEQDPR